MKLFNSSEGMRQADGPPSGVIFVMLLPLA